MSNRPLQFRVAEFISKLPKKVTTLPRPQFDSLVAYTYNIDLPKYKIKDAEQSVSMTVNYRVNGPYSDEQKVTYLGILVTVWHPLNTLVAKYLMVKPGKDYESVYKSIRRLAGRVRKECHHPHTEHVRGTGNCLNEYKCLDCGAVFEIDSSG